METLWMNGEYMPLSEGKIDLEDRSVLFADGIYEVIAAYEGTPILLDEHLDRWERSAAGLRIPQPYSRETRHAVIAELLQRLGSNRAMVYGQLSRGTARRAHQFPAITKPTEFWFARQIPDYKITMFTEGVKVVSHPDERWSRCWIKSTCLLANCLAKQFAHENGAFEAILIREDGTVTEGSAANFHVVKNGAIHTHPTDGRILAGVKRAMLLDIAAQEGVPVHEHKFDLDFVLSADEAFLTSTTINILPTTKCDDSLIANGEVGPLTKRLMAAMARAITVRLDKSQAACG